MRKATVPQIRPSCPRTATAARSRQPSACPKDWTGQSALGVAGYESLVLCQGFLRNQFVHIIKTPLLPSIVYGAVVPKATTPQGHRRFYDTIVPRFLQRKNKLSSPTGGHAHRERQRLPCFVLAWEPSAFPGAVGCGLPDAPALECPRPVSLRQIRTGFQAGTNSPESTATGQPLLPVPPGGRTLRSAPQGMDQEGELCKKMAALHASPAQKESQYFLYFHLVLENKAQKKNRLFPVCSS